MNTTFDALDYFQAQKSQERTALRMLEDARTAVDVSRSKLEEAESLLVVKRKQAADLKRKVADLHSTAIMSDQVELVASRAALVVTVEQKTLERTEKVQELLRHLEEEGDDHKKPTEEQSEYDSAVAVVDNAINRVTALEASRGDLAANLESLKENNKRLEEDCLTWEAKVAAARDELTTTKEEISKARERIQQIEDETTRVIRNAERIWTDKLDKAREYLKLEALELRNQAEKVSGQDQAELTQLQEALHLCNEQRAIIEAEKLKLESAWAQCQKEPLLDGDAVTSTLDLEMLKRQVEDESQKVQKLREALKPQNILWEERRKAEEAQLLSTYGKLIDPKREELLGLKRNLRDAEESNAKMHENYQKIMQDLENQIAGASKIPA